ncbi:unnamed protein product [Cochlearia groenlandica]
MRRVSWSTVFTVVVMVALSVLVPATTPGRVLREKSGPGETRTLSVEMMKSKIDSWFQRLASGPSPRGRGH